MTKANSSLSTAPEGYGIVTPWIISSDTTGLLDFVAKAFGARDPFSLDIGGGRIGHAEVRIGDSVVMGFDAAPDWPDTPAFLRIYVEDADQTVNRACTDARPGRQFAARPFPRSLQEGEQPQEPGRSIAHPLIHLGIISPWI